MAQISQLNTDVSTLFFDPLRQVYPSTDAQYRCGRISDLDFAALGISRCLSHTKTGHEFLQHHIDHGREGVSVDLFFKSLKSQRRLTNLSIISRTNNKAPYNGVESLPPSCSVTQSVLSERSSLLTEGCSER